jgi:hypothetical protein
VTRFRWCNPECACTLEETRCLSKDTAAVIAEKIKKVALLDTNRKALEAGRQFIDQRAGVGAETQPDGFA